MRSRPSQPLIAIVSAGAVLPGTRSARGLWPMLEAGHDALSAPPAGRWVFEPRRATDPNRPKPDEVACRMGGFVSVPDLDPDTWRQDHTPTSGGPWFEGDALDPSCRLALAAGTEAWSAAKIDPLDRERVGVIIANLALPTAQTCALSESVLGRPYAAAVARTHGMDLPGLPPVAPAPIHRWVLGLPATALARVLSLGGPAYGLDAACASSLFALHHACAKLQAGRLDAVLVGGVCRPDSLYTHMGFSQLRALSPTGRSLPFDRRADGLLVGEGAAVFMVKRLEDALAHGDRVMGVIRGIGLSNDTHGSLLAPSLEGQVRAMESAYRAAGIAPHDVDLIEAHATGTPLGDATELASLRQLWREAPGDRRAIVGSAKSNVGHLLTAAAAVGTLKVLLALEHRVLPPTANFDQPIEGLEPDGPFQVLRSSQPWADRTKRPRRAAVSAFGFGGTNAHAILEAFDPAAHTRRTPHAVAPALPDRIGVVGMGAHLGPYKTLEQLRPALLGGPCAAPATKRHTFGRDDTPRGWFIDELELDLRRFRIPPNELRRALPQQLVALQVAAAAIDDAKLEGTDPARVGVLVGTGLDLGTTGYHLRWALQSHASDWARGLGMAEDTQQFQAWLQTLCDGIHPPLDADRTLGGLGSVVASRIARAFGFGGDSYILASQDNAGMTALDAGVEALTEGRLDAVVVAAVDLTGDPRSSLSAQLMVRLGVARPAPFAPDAAGTALGEGACAVVLKRESDARRDRDRVYGWIRSIGSAQSASGRPTPQPATITAAWNRSLEQAELRAQDIDLLVAHGSGDPRYDAAEARSIAEQFRNAAGLTLASAKTTVGHCGAASGLVSVIAACLALYHRTRVPIADGPGLSRRVPRLEPLDLAMGGPQYWFARHGRRTAAVSSLSVTGDCTHAILEDADSSPQPFAGGPPMEGLFCLEVETDDQLLAGLDQLEQLAAASPQASGHELAQRWWTRRRTDAAPPIGLALLAQDAEDLKRRIAVVRRRRSNPSDLRRASAGRVFLGQRDELSSGELAFVFPGSGNHFPGMGRDLGTRWPGLLAQHEAIHPKLSGMMAAPLTYNGSAEDLDNNPTALLLAQTSLGILVSDFARGFGIEPDAAIGYSLGESVALFATGAWSARQEMYARVTGSRLFSHDLAGPCLAARKRWGQPDTDPPVRWTVGIVEQPASVVRRVIASFPRAYLLIVNTPSQCVIGGDADQVAATVAKLETRFVPLSGIMTVHCDVVDEVADQYRALHLLPTCPPDGIRFYSGAWARAYELSQERAADSILAQARDGIDFPQVIEQAYEDGVRVFVEIGPGASATRMIRETLGDRPHVARAVCVAGQDTTRSMLRALGQLVAMRRTVNLEALYGTAQKPKAPPPQPGTSVRIQVGSDAPVPPAPSARPRGPGSDSGSEVPRRLDRAACLTFARGALADVFGQTFGAVDAHPTRVRLPDEPLMLVDRVLKIEATPRGMDRGRIVTEHDITPAAWYLDGGRIPTCIAVEAGQADLMLSGFLGIDFQTHGRAMYRLLDAVVSFADELPPPGRTIQYDIQIERFFRQGETWLFRFSFDATVDGRPLLSMREGTAGFFTLAQLRDGQGIVDGRLRPAPARPSSNVTPPCPLSSTTLTPTQLSALRAGDLEGAFGAMFGGLDLTRPSTIPGGRMALVDRVRAIDPHGGFGGLASIISEADITPDDWFLTCHFVDDHVMPGTLMYEGCLHTLRILLMRMGFVGEADRVSAQPVPGVRSRLRCRGQVLTTTKTVAYEVKLKQLGYGPEPFAIADAIMYADGKRIVEVVDMSVRLCGLSRPEVEARWKRSAPGQRQTPPPTAKPGKYGKAHLLAYCEGNPSEAFGEPYRVFDRQRRLARLPRGPLLFIDEITHVAGAPFEMVAGASCEARFALKRDDWFFTAHRQRQLPFFVLLEAALQPCGWLAAYVGSALTLPDDLRFRNLGGEARVRAPVLASDDVLATRVKLAQVSSSGGMIIQHYAFSVESRTRGPVYEGTTYFGFFSAQALEQQVGLRQALKAEPTADQRRNTVPVRRPDAAPFPTRRLRMLDEVGDFVVDGGSANLGFIEGYKRIDPSEWFFDAHFYQDPVWPGSLGIEAFLQLLTVVATHRFSSASSVHYIAGDPGAHSWVYRGQVVPGAKRVTVQAEITAFDQSRRRIHANGWLSVDGRTIYSMKDFVVEVV